MRYDDRSLFHALRDNNKVVDKDLGLKVDLIHDADTSYLIDIDMVLLFLLNRKRLAIALHYDALLFDEETIHALFDEYLLYTAELVRQAESR